MKVYPRLSPLALALLLLIDPWAVRIHGQEVAPSAAPVLESSSGGPTTSTPGTAATPRTVPADNGALTRRNQNRSDSLWKIGLLLAAFALVAVLSRLVRRR